jgi:GT2 family glycosyltransferase
MKIKQNEVLRNFMHARDEHSSSDALGSNGHTVKAGLASIVIPVFNQVRFTKSCLRSIFQNTDYPFELIVVDNGSTDDTSQYLANVPNIRVVRNEINRGVPKANNQGVRASRGEYVMLLNNDTIVTPCWLSRMVACAEHEHSIGIVGSITNDTSAGVQGDENARYADIAGLYSYAEERSRKFAEKAFRYPMIPSMAMLVKRQVFDRIGLFDETFSPGNFDDDDFCVRALHADFDLVIAEDAFVHHFGSRTFGGAKMSYESITEKNRRLFHKKWGPSPYTDALLGRFRKLDVKNLVSIVLVASGRPDSLKKAIASVLNQTYRHFELIVVNESGTDLSPVLECEDDRIVHVWREQRKGIATARNAGLQRATGEYIAYLDEDTVYYPDHLESLVAALATTSCSVTYGGCRRVVRQVDTQAQWPPLQIEVLNRDYRKERLLLIDYIPITSVMHTRSLLDRIGFFDGSLSFYDHWDLLIRLAQSSFFYHCDRVTSEVHLTGQALNSRCYRQRLNAVKSIHSRYGNIANRSRNARLLLASGVELMQLIGQRRMQKLLSFSHRLVMSNRYLRVLEYRLQLLGEIARRYPSEAEESEKQGTTILTCAG